VLSYPAGVRILAISGSLQARSSNLDLLKTAVAVAPDGVEVAIFDGLRDLPLFNPDLETDGAAPSSVQTWRRVLAERAAVLIATPEYGHSLPGSLKNAVDWVIGSGELERKVVAITASTNHPKVCSLLRTGTSLRRTPRSLLRRGTSLLQARPSPLPDSSFASRRVRFPLNRRPLRHYRRFIHVRGAGCLLNRRYIATPDSSFVSRGSGFLLNRR
jgi:hypothetical protein